MLTVYQTCNNPWRLLGRRVTVVITSYTCIHVPLHSKSIIKSKGDIIFVYIRSVTNETFHLNCTLLIFFHNQNWYYTCGLKIKGFRSQYIGPCTGGSNILISRFQKASILYLSRQRRQKWTTGENQYPNFSEPHILISHFRWVVSNIQISN